MATELGVAHPTDGTIQLELDLIHLMPAECPSHHLEYGEDLQHQLPIPEVDDGEQLEPGTNTKEALGSFGETYVLEGLLVN